MKTTLQLFLTLLATAGWLAAQTPPPSGAITIDPNATNRDAIIRELLRRSMVTNTPPGGPPSLPMSTQPPEAVRTLRALPTPLAPAAPTAPVAGAVQPAATPNAPSVPSPASSRPSNPPAFAATTAASATNDATTKTNDQVYLKDSVRFQGLELDEFLDKVYSEAVGRTIIRAPGLPGTTKITFRNVTSLSRPEFMQLLDSVLAMNGISMIPVGEKFVKAVPTAQALQEAAPFDQRSPKDLPDSGQYLTHVLQLKYVRPSEVQPIIQPFSKSPGGIVLIENSGVIVLRDNVENVKRILELIEKLDVRVEAGDIKSEVIPIKYALAAEISSVLGTLTGSGGGASSGTSGGLGSSTRAGGTRGSTSRGGVGGLGGAAGGFGGGGLPGQPGYNPSAGGALGQPGGIGGLGGNTGSFGAAGGTQNQFQQRLQQIVQRAAGSSGSIPILGDVRIIADERTNSLLVFANDLDMRTIKAIIAKLDVVLAQVLIESIIMGVGIDDDLSYGVSVAQKERQISGSFAGAGAINANKFFDFGNVGTNLATDQLEGKGFRYFGKINEDILVSIEAAATDGRVNVIQRPRIQTSHAKPASLFIGSTVPYVTGTTYGGQGFNGGSTYQQLRVGIGLNVTPFINQDGLVVMAIDQTIDELDGSTFIEGVGNVPNTASRTLSADIAVRDRETVILGGIIRSSDQKGSSGVPLLKDLPVLGFLFSSKTSTQKRTELIVLMRPTVLPTPEAAATMTRYEKDNLPGILAAERASLKEQADLQRQQGVDPDRGAPIFNDPRKGESTEILLPFNQPVPTPTPPAEQPVNP